MARGDTSAATVLIVEDDLALLAFLVTRLEYEPDLRVVGYATDGREGLELAETLRPDVVLSDVDLPEMDGVELIGSLRALLPNAALVLYTAAVSPKLERAAKLHGADECLDKSIPPSVVVAAVRRSLAARGNRVLPAAEVAGG